MDLKLSFDWYLIFVFLGIFQALLLSVLIYIKGRKSGSRFMFLSLFIFSLCLLLAEVFLDYSGYILNVIQIDKFSHPAQLLLAPSLFLFIRTSLYPNRPATSLGSLYSFHIHHSVFFDLLFSGQRIQV